MAKPGNKRHIGGVYYVGDPAEFKARNKAEWIQNADFWLQGKMRHLRDVYDTVVLELRQILLSQSKPEAEVLVIDTGCGEGWAIRALADAGFVGRYVGLDFNPVFVETLREKYCNDENKEFRLNDLEDDVPEDLVSQGQVILNFFNLFELPQLDIAFHNISRLVAPGGSLLILHIDPMMQLLAISASLEEFYGNLKLYEQHRMHLGYDKDIDIGDARSGRFYRSLMYTASDYIRCAKAQGLHFENLYEIVKTGNYVPQIYQVLHFKRD